MEEAPEALMLRAPRKYRREEGLVAERRVVVEHHDRRRCSNVDSRWRRDQPHLTREAAPGMEDSRVVLMYGYTRIYGV